MKRYRNFAGRLESAGIVELFVMQIWKVEKTWNLFEKLSYIFRNWNFGTSEVRKMKEKMRKYYVTEKMESQQKKVAKFCRNFAGIRLLNFAI